MASIPISVLHFSNSVTRGGVEDHILTLLRGLDSKLFRQHLVCSPVVADKLRAVVPDNVELIELDFRKITEPTGGLRLWQILRDRRISILHSHMFWSSLFASPIGYAARVPVIVETPHIREHWRKGFKSHFFVDRMIGRCVNHYIAVSEANRRYLIEEKCLPAHKIVVIRSGSDIRGFDRSRVAPSDLKRKLGFAESDPVLVVVGRLEQQKGHSVLLNALPTVLNEFPAVRVVFVGEGSLQAQLEEQASGLGLQKAVRILSYQKDLTEWLALADFTVLPSLWEGLPLTPIESLAAGRTVVATAVDGTPEVVVDGVTGLTVPPGDPLRLAEAICRLLRNPELRLRLANAGYELVLKNFTHERLIAETRGFYVRAWERRFTSPCLHTQPMAESPTR